MERREDIRATMQALLIQEPSPRQVASANRAPKNTAVVAADVIAPASPLPATVLRDIQAALSEYGVEGSLQEITDLLMAALISRPALCRGLFAAHLLGE